jgi:hypothetical protein
MRLRRPVATHQSPGRLYQLEHCLDTLGWACQADQEYFAQAKWLIVQVLDGIRLRLA